MPGIVKLGEIIGNVVEYGIDLKWRYFPRLKKGDLGDGQPLLGISLRVRQSYDETVNRLACDDEHRQLAGGLFSHSCKCTHIFKGGFSICKGARFQARPAHKSGQYVNLGRVVVDHYGERPGRILELSVHKPFPQLPISSRVESEYCFIVMFLLFQQLRRRNVRYKINFVNQGQDAHEKIACVFCLFH
jgi:hypothetical protein